MEYFELGSWHITTGAREALSSDEEMLKLLGWHARGDWGTVSDEDKRSNDEALMAGGRLLSAYTSSTGVKIWVITEADRSATTLLLPEEY